MRTRNRTYYVYTLAYPDGSVFYVGKGSGVRIFCHEDEARTSCDCRKCRVIRQIWVEGETVQKQFVFETGNEDEALARESALILRYGEPLTNVRGVAHKGKDAKKTDRTVTWVEGSSSISDLQSRLEHIVLDSACFGEKPSLEEFQILERMVKTGREIDLHATNVLKVGEHYYSFVQSSSGEMSFSRIRVPLGAFLYGE